MADTDWPQDPPHKLEPIPNTASAVAWLAFQMGHAAGCAEGLGYGAYGHWLLNLAYGPDRDRDHLEAADGTWIALAVERQGQRYLDAIERHTAVPEENRKLMAAWHGAIIQRARELERSSLADG